MHMRSHRLAGALLAVLLGGCFASGPAQRADRYDLIVRNGMVYDGSGGAARQADVGIRGDRIAAIGDLANARGRREIDAKGHAVAPGFINVLSWAPDALIADGRSMSDILQGVTLEVFGEGWSYGPLTAAMKKEARDEQGDIRYAITWTSLGEFMTWLEKRGISPNIASFVGASTVRQNVLGNANRAPAPAELERMQALVREAMEQGALGVASALIYFPGSYAKTDELTALATAAAPYGGAYISHLRSEGDRLLQGIDELVGIARAAGVHAEIYHLKAAGRDNWPKMREAIARIDAARARGLSISANMYAYTAGATGLNACMPPAVQEGELDAWIGRLKDPVVRAQLVTEMRQPGKDWENLCYMAGDPGNVVLIGFKNAKLKPMTGKTLADVARLRGTSPEDAAIDLVIEDHAHVDTAFFLMSEDNVKLGLSQTWTALGSDEGSFVPAGVFLKSQPHPRAYGNFARFLGRYVRDEQVDTLPDAVRRLSGLPADNFKLRDRGYLKDGYHADLVVFDPATIADHARYDDPRKFATGVSEVVVNGVEVVRDGRHTGAKPGRFVPGPGYRIKGN
ncbi:N-acyl-D-amino-acid deacylase family protein [Dokdonella soli]|uniref:D-aminoacylase n=1 Tax=Dokdonella soli TaxID=529810 RepID=A0ABP3TJ47_9GAMM